MVRQKNRFLRIQHVCSYRMSIGEFDCKSREGCPIALTARANFIARGIGRDEFIVAMLSGFHFSVSAVY